MTTDSDDTASRVTSDLNGEAESSAQMTSADIDSINLKKSLAQETCNNISMPVENGFECHATGKSCATKTSPNNCLLDNKCSGMKTTNCDECKHDSGGCNIEDTIAMNGDLSRGAKTNISHTSSHHAAARKPESCSYIRKDDIIQCQADSIPSHSLSCSISPVQDNCKPNALSVSTACAIRNGIIDTERNNKTNVAIKASNHLSNDHNDAVVETANKNCRSGAFIEQEDSSFLDDIDDSNDVYVTSSTVLEKGHSVGPGTLSNTTGSIPDEALDARAVSSTGEIMPGNSDAAPDATHESVAATRNLSCDVPSMESATMKISFFTDHTAAGSASKIHNSPCDSAPAKVAITNNSNILNVIIPDSAICDNKSQCDFDGDKNVDDLERSKESSRCAGGMAVVVSEKLQFQSVGDQKVINVDVVVPNCNSTDGISSTNGGATTISSQPPLELSLDPEQLRAALKTQLEYYFSFENLARDKYMRAQMDEDQYIKIEVVACFNLVRRLTHSLQLVTDVLREISGVQVDGSGLKARRVNQRSTLILREVPSTTPVADVEALFKHEACPPVVSCEFAHNDNWYVTFESEQEAHAAYRYLHEVVQTFLGKPIMARMKARQRLIAASPTSSASSFDRENGTSRPPPSFPPPPTLLFQYPSANPSISTGGVSGISGGIQQTLPYQTATIPTVSFVANAPQSFPFFPPRQFISQLWNPFGFQLLDPNAANLCFAETYAAHMASYQQQLATMNGAGTTSLRNRVSSNNGNAARLMRKETRPGGEIGEGATGKGAGGVGGGSQRGGTGAGGRSSNERHHSEPLDRPSHSETYHQTHQPPRFSRAHANNQEMSTTGGGGAREFHSGSAPGGYNNRSSRVGGSNRAGGSDARSSHISPPVSGSVGASESCSQDSGLVRSDVGGSRAGSSGRRYSDSRSSSTTKDGVERNGGQRSGFRESHGDDTSSLCRPEGGGRGRGGGGGYRGARRRNYPEDGTSTNRPQSLLELATRAKPKETPSFDLEASAFPPLPGAATTLPPVSGGETLENKMADVVKALAKDSSIGRWAAVSRPAANQTAVATDALVNGAINSITNHGPVPSATRSIDGARASSVGGVTTGATTAGVVRNSVRANSCGESKSSPEAGASTKCASGLLKVSRATSTDESIACGRGAGATDLKVSTDHKKTDGGMSSDLTNLQLRDEDRAKSVSPPISKISYAQMALRHKDQLANHVQPPSATSPGCSSSSSDQPTVTPVEPVKLSSSLNKTSGRIGENRRSRESSMTHEDF